MFLRYYSFSQQQGLGAGAYFDVPSSLCESQLAMAFTKLRRPGRSRVFAMIPHDPFSK
jgi:hypothetical protein